MTASNIAAQPSPTYAAPTSQDRQGLIAECISSILAGTALPEALRPREIAPSRPATVAEGIARILGGRAA